MKRIYLVLTAVGALWFCIVALSTAATIKDIIGTYELTCKETFYAKGYGSEKSIDHIQLVLRPDNTYIMGDTEGIFSLNSQGTKILLKMGE